MAPTRIIGITGKAGSGKSEAAQHLMDAHGFSRVKFAGPLKAMLIAYYRELGLRFDEINRRIEGDLKEVPCQYLNGRTPRFAMQSLGTEWGRTHMGDDFWVEAWKHQVDRSETDVVTDDVRYDNEAAMIKALSMGRGRIIRIETAEHYREYSKHYSEDGIDDKFVDTSIRNDGTLQDLRLMTTRYITDL